MQLAVMDWHWQPLPLVMNFFFCASPQENDSKPSKLQNVYPRGGHRTVQDEIEALHGFSHHGDALRLPLENRPVAMQWALSYYPSLATTSVSRRRLSLTSPPPLKSVHLVSLQIRPELHSITTYC